MSKIKKFLALSLSISMLSFGSITSFAAPSLVSVQTDFSDPTIPVCVPLLSYSGTGDSVIQNVALPEGFAYKVSFTHDGKRNFIVHFLNGDEKDLLANKIGEYAGTALLEDGSTSARNGILQIKADGNWTITISTITNVTSRSMYGTGDKVTGQFVLTNQNNIVTLNNVGDSNFIVYARFSDGDRELLANEIGTYSGQVILKNKPGCTCYLEIRSCGQWSIDLGYGECPTPVADIN